MTPFEEQLKKALARQEPPQDFTKRVVERLNERSARHHANTRGRWLHRVFAWRLAPVMAALLLLSGGFIYREHEREVSGLAAKQKLLTALQIAGSKLHETRQHVLEFQDKGIQE